MRSTTRQTFTVFLILLSGLIVLRLWYGRTAPLPDAFADALPLPQAIERAAQLNKPVFVLATADWCPPCQHLKRTALRDERVANAIRERTVPVYLDVTSSTNEEVVKAANQLNVTELPAMILLSPEGEIARLIGDRNALELLSWLESRTRTD